VAKEARFFPLHNAAIGGAAVVEAFQVENAVNDVSNYFRFPSCAESARLADGDLNAHEDFTVQSDRKF
jgi:hypothetical protein